MKTRVISFAAVCALLSPLAASAQERGQVGLTMGFPASIGVIWHPTDRIAVRPEISLANGSSESDVSIFGISTENDTSAFTVSASMLWYLRPAEGNVRPYVSPRLAYTRTTSSHAGIDGPTISGTSLAGSFGVQYAPVSNFSVFGEAGYGVTTSESKLVTPIGTSRMDSTMWSTRTAVGVIFYFGKT